MAAGPGRRAWARLHWRKAFPVAPLLLALIAATIMYWPALDSPFVSDDYVYLYSVEKLSFGDYARAALVPGADNETLIFAKDFYRPLYFLAFQATGRLFGNNVVPYHVVNLGIHLAAVVLVWTIALRVSERWEAAAIAAAVFAVHPAGFDSIAWISSVNSVALPLALGAWLSFMVAVDARSPASRNTLLALSTGLLAIAMGFRETSVALLPVMVAWYALVHSRDRLRDPRACLVFVPYAALIVAYALLRTKLLTAPAANGEAYNVDWHAAEHAWYYLRIAFFPFDTRGDELRTWLQRMGGVAILATIPVTLMLKRWLLAALTLGFVCAVSPYAPLTLGVSPRYFYFPSAFFAIALGAAGLEALAAIRRLMPEAAVRAVFAASIPLVLTVGTVVGGNRLDRWLTENPDEHQRWVDQLRAEYPELPAGGTLYTTDTPLIIALFGYYALQPTVGYYYPQVERVERFQIEEIDQIQRRLGPNDRIFVYDPLR